MSLGPWEFVIIILFIVILFGGKKLPELARGLGLGLKEFKNAKREIKDEIQNATDEINVEENEPQI